MDIEVINVCDKVSKYDAVSDSDDSTENLPSLKERILLLHGENKRKTFSKCMVSHVHSISESEDSEAEPESVKWIPEDCKATKLTNCAEEKDINNKSDEEWDIGKFISEPVVLVEPVLTSNQVLSKTAKRRKIAEKQSPDSKNIEKEERIRLREEKRKEKELAKALKLSEKEIQKRKRPEECLKSMKIIVDHNIIFEDGSQDAFCVLDENNLKYSIEENPINLSIKWYRTVISITMENGQVVKEERDELENILVLLISNKDFVQMVYASSQKVRRNTKEEPTLLEHITNIKSLFPMMDITCAIVGLGKYIREMKENANIDIERKRVLKQVSKTASEEVATEVQLQAFVNFIFLDSMKEFGDTLFRFTKAIAEAPLKKEKQLQKGLAFSWYADADTSCPVKLEKDASGCIKLWQQQIQQFQNVGPEVAEAIVSKYPSPRHLMEAYKRCRSTKEAEILLQDIVVRRTYGPLGTQRRVGPELSYKIYLFFNSTDGNQLLQR
ncbi:crossover junction endonuclease EME1-like [Stegodyphus dumicola]|uniref:crossover junction endonuclease EME1-like n=1 Tax=Stegodyphus dumicola TaxID=202533 RepID=UPI0015B23D9E|nr:crossover junction endonuclease EME1-like [Stegodyphus dumicola]